MLENSAAPMLRRSFLQAAAVGAAGLMAAEGGAAERECPPALDAHTHFYDPTRPEGVPWPGMGDKRLYRKVLPAEFKELTGPQRVRSTIVVEASPWVEDNQWLIDLAAKEPFIVGVVGNLNPSDPKFAEHLTRFAKQQPFRGIRVNHGDLAKGLGDRSYFAHLKLLVDHDCELDVNGGPAMPAEVARLAKLLPELRIVINHAANLPIDGKAPPQAWRDGLTAAAEGKNVFCKVSALVEATGRRERDAPTDVEFYRPVLDALWERFGEDRLIYASNWPVCENAASYATVHAIVRAYFNARGKGASEKFFLGNALRAYKVG